MLLLASTSNVTFLPVVVPGYNLVLIVLLLCTLYVRMAKIEIKIVHIIFLFISTFMYTYYYAGNFIAALPQYVLSVLLALFVFTLSKKDIDVFVKWYIVMVFILSINIIIGFIIVNIIGIENIEFCQQLFHFIQDGSKQPERSYLSPCYLSLFEYKKYPDYTLLGYFLRGSGWSNEPVNAAYFMIPAVSMLAFNKDVNDSNKDNVMFLFIIIALTVVVFSVTGLFMMVMLFAVKYLVRSKYYSIIIMFLAPLLVSISYYGNSVVEYLLYNNFVDDAPIILVKFHANRYYLDQIILLLIPLFVLLLLLSKYVRIFVRNKNFNAAVFVIVVACYFMYLLKNEIGSAFPQVLSGLFKNPAFFLWSSLFIVTITNKYKREVNYDLISSNHPFERGLSN